MSSGFLALGDRALALLAVRETVSDEELLEHVYGGKLPPGVRGRLLEPLLAESRIQRGADGRWRALGEGRPARSHRLPLPDAPLTVVALAATGPRPQRSRLLAVSAHHLDAGEIVERFSATLNPGSRVPGYVLQRAGLAPNVLDSLPALVEVIDDLISFLGARPIVAQEVALAWQFLASEARRLGRRLLERQLVDANELASRVLELDAKPTLALVAQRLGIAVGRIERPDEEARVLSLVAPRLLAQAAAQGITSFGTPEPGGTRSLRRAETARSLPDLPGVYVLRDVHNAALYVGKARRLSGRLAAYVHRPLGATRRLEGLADAVNAVDVDVCETDLEALILEDREIRRLRPRFNTQRHLRAPRVWLRLPPQPAPRPGKRQLVPPRLELVEDPKARPGDYLGPFRNPNAAQHARELAREVFELDTLRRAGDRRRYAEQLRLAWAFLNGDADVALAVARSALAAATGARDHAAVRAWERRVAAIRAYDPRQELLPADPRCARYAVVRPGPNGTDVEVFVLDRGILLARASHQAAGDEVDLTRWCADLLASSAPRTQAADRDVVLRWLGAQRSSARLVSLADDPRAAAASIEAAITDVLELALRSREA